MADEVGRKATTDGELKEGFRVLPKFGKIVRESYIRPDSKCSKKRAENRGQICYAVRFTQGSAVLQGAFLSQSGQRHGEEEKLESFERLFP